MSGILRCWNCYTLETTKRVELGSMVGHKHILSKIHDLKTFRARYSNFGFQENEIKGIRRQEELLW